MATRTAILISGSGTNLQAFIDRVRDGCLDLALAVVFSNRPDAYGLERAARAGIDTLCIEHSAYNDRVSFDRALTEALERYAPELIVLAGFMRILSAHFVRRYEGRILNVHPALLPRYPGLNTHQRVLDAGDRHHGSTVHFVTDALDAGPRIIAGRIPVLAGESAAELGHRIQAVEHQIYPEAAAWFASGRLVFRDNAAWLDGDRLDEPVLFEFDAAGRQSDVQPIKPSAG